MLYEDDFQNLDDEVLTDIPEDEDEGVEEDEVGADEEEEEAESY